MQPAVAAGCAIKAPSERSLSVQRSGRGLERRAQASIFAWHGFAADRTSPPHRAAVRGRQRALAPLKSLKGLGPRAGGASNQAPRQAARRAARRRSSLASAVGLCRPAVVAFVQDAAPGAIATLVVTPVRYQAPPEVGVPRAAAHPVRGRERLARHRVLPWRPQRRPGASAAA